MEECEQKLAEMGDRRGELTKKNGLSSSFLFIHIVFGIQDRMARYRQHVTQNRTWSSGGSKNNPEIATADGTIAYFF